MAGSSAIRLTPRLRLHPAGGPAGLTEPSRMNWQRLYLSPPSVADKSDDARRLSLDRQRRGRLPRHLPRGVCQRSLATPRSFDLVATAASLPRWSPARRRLPAGCGVSRQRARFAGGLSVERTFLSPFGSASLTHCASRNAPGRAAGGASPVCAQVAETLPRTRRAENGS